MTLKEKYEKAINALDVYGNVSLWHYGGGIPKVDKEKYGNKKLKYNALGLRPYQHGWEHAQKVLKELRR